MLTLIRYILSFLTLTLFFLQGGGFFAFAQTKIEEVAKHALYDSINQTQIYKDSVDIEFADSDLDAPVDYQATDSIVYDIHNKKLFLYGASTVKYTDFNIKAAVVSFDWNTSTLDAKGIIDDSTGKLSGTPEFTNKGDAYKARRMKYNFKSGKGKIYNVITQEGDAYIHSDQVKRDSTNTWYGKQGKFTTCDHDHPHFYFNAKRIKTIPDKVIVTGPVNLVVGDAPTPLYLPFGIFPLKKGQRSGIILPRYGESASRGFFFQDLGGYWAVNNKLGLKFLSTIFTNGDVGFSVEADYKKIYKVNGNMKLAYFRRQTGDPQLPNSSISNELSFQWRLALDNKARPFNNFNVNINISTRRFNQNAFENSEELLNTQLNSDFSYVRTFLNKPYRLNISARHTQNLLTGSLNILLPQIGFSGISYNPFKPKIKTQKQKWYEKINLTYSAETRAELRTFDSLLTNPGVVRDIDFGVQQRAGVNIPFTLFKNITINPSFSYVERWYIKRIDKRWEPQGDEGQGAIVVDTSYGFYGVRDFNTSLRVSTKVYGLFNFSKTKFVKGFRHILTPSISFTYHPDFGNSFWGYYDDVQSDADGSTQRYSHYEVGSIYGRPTDGASGTINFLLLNSFELKTLAIRDTTKTYNKIGLLDNLTVSANYNFLADSFRMSNLNIVGNTKIIEGLSMRFNVSLDPYFRDAENRRSSRFRWDVEKRLFTFQSANFSINGQINSSILSKKNKKLQFRNPWSINMSYNLNVVRRLEQGEVRNAISTNSITWQANFNITDKWKFNLSTGVDFSNVRIGTKALPEMTLTNLGVVRDLHCWQLSFDWTAFPVERQTYRIELRVKSSTLSDLKLKREKKNVDNF